jgi:hypothetical protein
MDTNEEKLNRHKEFAIELNNEVWNLLGKADRSEDENERMIHAAHASCYHWLYAGTTLHRQRGEWLISHVYAVLQHGLAALHYAKSCLQITEAEGYGGFDLAYAYEAMARAYAALGDTENTGKFLELAKQAGEAIQNREDKALFLSDLKAEPWFGIIE